MARKKLFRLLYIISFVVRNRKLPPLSERLSKTTEIEKTTLDIEEDGVKLRYLAVPLPSLLNLNIKNEGLVCLGMSGSN